MGYWTRELSVEAMGLQHHSPSKFYVSCWQSGSSPLPLLLLRCLLFLVSLAIFVTSLVMFSVGPLYLIYFTQWGIMMLVLTTCASTAVSALAYFRRLPEPSYGLPWYVQAYWVLYNITAPIAFIITLFYWAVLHSSDMLVDYAPNIFLDVSLHGVNSVVMLAEVLAAGHPSRLLHLYQPVGFGMLYLIFGLVYYFADGVDPWGNPWVYPVIDWRNPGPTAGVVAATTLVVILLHFFTVGLARLRDFAAGRLLRKEPPSPGVSNDAFVAA